MPSYALVTNSVYEDVFRCFKVIDDAMKVVRDLWNRLPRIGKGKPRMLTREELIVMRDQLQLVTDRIDESWSVLQALNETIDNPIEM